MHRRWAGEPIARGDFTGGCWPQTKATLHINALELMAATFRVQVFCKGTQVKSVLLKTDNSTVLAYINKMGGTKSPNFGSAGEGSLAMVS